MPSIDRVGPNDLVHLASDDGPAPDNFAAVLLLEGTPPDLAELRTVLSHRVRAVPRLRRTLRPAPFGCGRPVWVDDPAFDIAAHVTAVTCPAPGDEGALLALAADIAARHLPRDRPLWEASLVTELANGQSAVVIVLHHALADGVAGLAILGALVDGAPLPPPVAFPLPPPTRWQLLVDATRSRVLALTRFRTALRVLWSMRLFLRRPRVPVARTSLNAPTGSQRRLRCARADLQAAQAVAHARGGTVNDVVLTAVTGALRQLLEVRGERLEQLAVSIPAAARSTTTSTALGNEVGLVVAMLPMTEPDPIRRLDAIVPLTRAAKDPGRVISPAAFTVISRMLVGTRLARHVIDHQRLVHTFVTNVRGPHEPLSINGRRVVAALPVSVVSGNVAIAFGVLSYAGTLAVTVVADPQHFPDLDVVGAALQSELDALVGIDRTSQPPGGEGPFRAAARVATVAGRG